MGDRVRIVVLAMGVGGGAAAAPAATLVVLNKGEATASLIDAASGRLLATVATGEGPHELAVSPDGRLAVVGNYGVAYREGDEVVRRPGTSLSVIDIAAARELRRIELGGYSWPHGLAWLPGGRQLLVTAEAQQALLRVDVETGEVERVVETGQEISHMVVATGDGKRAFVANIGSGSVTAVDLERGRKLADMPTGKGAEGLALTPDDRWLWVTNRAEDTLSVIDVTTLEQVARIECGSFPIRAAATPDGRHLLVTNARSGDLAVFDAETREELHRIELPLSAGETSRRLFGDAFGASSVPIGILVAPDGKRAWVAHANADLISVIDLERWQPLGKIAAGREPDGLGWSRRTVEPKDTPAPGHP